MARPRKDNVPITTGICPVHGVVEMRVHKIGYDRQGKQRFRARCPECHAERNNPKE